MTTLMLESEPVATGINVTRSALTVELGDGRTLSIPLSWYPRLLHSSESELENWQLLGNGSAIEWPDLDEHIGVDGLLAGRRSAESQKSFSRWLAGRT